MSEFVLAIDQGTTSSRAILFDKDQNIAAVAQREFTQHFPDSGWVEHDPEDIWNTVVETVREAIGNAGIEPNAIKAIGITNQRETTLLWDRETGKPVYNAIVWQDRRTAEFCETLKKAGKEAEFTSRTGLLLDPYFSGTKLRWILDNVEGAREKASSGKLAFGTVDTFLLWHLTGGKVHATDATNASRTLMFNIAENSWDDDLLTILDVPRDVLPDVQDCNAEFGMTDPALFGASLPVRGIAGDQQAAAIGQACFAPGMLKSTYGTGCFALL
ncbi:MAG: FGGY family carbohydrate kinase, partial [Pseudomonadota bacterium]